MNRYESMIDKLYGLDSDPIRKAENAVEIAFDQVHYRDADYSVLEDAEFNLEVAEALSDYDIEQDRILIEQDLANSFYVFTLDDI